MKFTIKKQEPTRISFSIKNRSGEEVIIAKDAIVEVETLPTEDIDVTIFYRTKDGVFWYFDGWHMLADAEDVQDLNVSVADNTKRISDIEKQLENTNIQSAIKVTYSELKNLRDSGQLVPGVFYRITDYICATVQKNTHAMNNKFDIIIQALSENTLSENAKADYHYNEDGTPDGYFQKIKKNYFELEPLFTIVEDEESVSESYSFSDDKFITYDYIENPDGDIVPVLYKTDVLSYPEEPDYADVFYYVGTYVFNDEVYDRWRKIDIDYGWDNPTKRYILTDRIVEDGKIADNILGIEETIVKVANIPAWEIKYCLDNDTTRFAWADDSNGTGVIYYMKDEHGNECSYDFKNIQFKRMIYLESNYPELDEDNGEETWVYTFCGNSHKIERDSWSELKDGSLEGPYGHMSDDDNSTFHHNIIKPYVILYDGKDIYTKCGKVYLNDIVLFGFWDEIGSMYEDDAPYYSAYCCFNNVFNDNCYSNTFNIGCSNNIFGTDCNNNILGTYCKSNIFKDKCYYNFFDTGCSYNTLNYNCYDIKLHISNVYNNFGCMCSSIRINGDSNEFGNECQNILSGIECLYNNFGDQCADIVLGAECSHNSFGSNCIEIELGNKCTYNLFDSYVYENILLNNCSFNKFGTGCNLIDLYNNCIFNTFENGSCSVHFGNYCSYNHIGKGCNTIRFEDTLEVRTSRVKNVRVAPGNSFVYLINYEDSDDYVQNITISSDIKGTYDAPLVLEVERNAPPVVYEASGTTHIILD